MHGEQFGVGEMILGLLTLSATTFIEGYYYTTTIFYSKKFGALESHGRVFQVLKILG